MISGGIKDILINKQISRLDHQKIITAIWITKKDFHS